MLAQYQDKRLSGTALMTPLRCDNLQGAMVAPKNSLAKIQTGFSRGNYQITESAREGYRELGFSLQQVLDVIASLQESDCTKNLESNKHKFSNPKQGGHWQDVYKPTRFGVVIYLKLSLRKPPVLISFKRK